MDPSPYDGSIIIIPILCIRKPKHTECEQLALDETDKIHNTAGIQSQILNTEESLPSATV